VFVRFCRFLFILAVLIASLSSFALPQKGNASMHGIVVVPTGSPVPGATIAVEGKGGAQGAITDINGEFNISGLNPGSYSVKITAPGFQPFEVQVSVSGSLVQEVDAVLTFTPKPVEPAPAPAEVPGANPPVTETPGQVPGAEPAPSPVQNSTQNPAQVPTPQNPMQNAAPTTVAAPQNFSVTAQKGKAAVYGNVTDQSNAVIQGGTAVATGKGGPITATVNAHGQYVLNGLAPGQYKLNVSAAGFASFETDLTLTADQSVEIDATLQPPSAKTEVNVEASNAASVETQSAHIEGTITEKEVLETGLNGRNFTQLIALAPGVSNQTGQDEAKVGVAGSVKYSVNGGRVEYNNFDVDGSDVLNAGLNGAESTLMVYPSLDAISEVKVLTSNYGAEYGRTASGTVLVTTKSGTPEFHGGAYEFLRNEFFNARNYFDPQGKAPLYRRQDFGFTLGGPLSFSKAKKKTFFFWSEEFRLEKSPLGPGDEPGDFNQAVPTLAERSGNFSDVCPLTLPGTTTTFKRAQYPDCPQVDGGTYPGNLLGAITNGTTPNLDTQSVTLMNALIPPPNSATGCNSSLVGQTNIQTGQLLIPCYVAAISPPTYWREELGRIDHHFTDNLSLAFRYIHDSWNTTTPVPQWGYLQTAAVHEQSFPTVENKLNGPGTSMVLRLTHAISPSLLNEFVISYVNSNITLQDASGPGGNIQATVQRGTDLTTQATGIGYIFNNGFGGNKLPGLLFGGTNAAYGGNGFAVDTSYEPWEHTNPTYSLADNVTKAIKTHTLQFGIQAVNARRSETNGAIGSASGDVQGLLGFSNFAGSTTGASTGNAFADFLVSDSNVNDGQPIVASYQQDSAQLKYYNNYWIAEPYVQDDWRVMHRLTVNLGVRLSLFGNYHEKNLNAWNWEQSVFNQELQQQLTNGTAVTVDPFNGNLVTGNTPVPLNATNPLSGLNPAVINGLVQCGKNGIPASCMSSHTFNPAPRIGFAWDPKGDGKTSIRGGYGLFYEHGTPKEANTGSLEGGPPLNLTMTQLNPNLGYDGIGNNGDGSTMVNGAITGVAFPIDVTSIPTKSIWPYAQQWSFSVQRQLPKDTVATLAYVGSKGTHLSAELQLNQLTVPPTGPEGIFLTGNPYAPGQPITSQDCSSYTGGPAGSFTVGKNPIGQVTPIPVTVTPHEAAWPNLLAACYSLDAAIQNPQSTTFLPQPNFLRTFAPGLGRVLSLQDIADSEYHALQSTIRRTRGPLTVGASYTYSHSIDDSSDRSDASFVNSANIKSNRASSSFDQRHSLSVNYIYAFPKLSGAFDRSAFHAVAESDGSDTTGTKPPAQSNSQLLRAMLDGWELSGITAFQSGTPFTVVNGGSGATGLAPSDNAGVANGSGVGSFPDVIGDPRAPVPQRFNASSVGPLLFNPAAFAAPQGLTFGDAGRNFLNNPHRLNFDMNLLKHFKVTEGSTMEFRVEVFNAFNHTQFRIFNPNIGNTASNTIGCYGGVYNSAAGGLTPVIGSPGALPINVDCTTGSALFHPVDSHRPRTMQLGLKYSF
jgi:Carboxypeptidase regulatory-like domain